MLLKLGKWAGDLINLAPLIHFRYDPGLVSFDMAKTSQLWGRLPHPHNIVGVICIPGGGKGTAHNRVHTSTKLPRSYSARYAILFLHRVILRGGPTRLSSDPWRSHISAIALCGIVLLIWSPPPHTHALRSCMIRADHTPCLHDSRIPSPFRDRHRGHSVPSLGSMTL